MSQTRSGEASDGGSRHKQLADGIRTDLPEDTRDCPHECHGHLTVDEDDRVICTLCRCDPDGVYYPPEPWDDSESTTRSSGSNPHPSRVQNHHPDRPDYDETVWGGRTDVRGGRPRCHLGVVTPTVRIDTEGWRGDNEEVYSNETPRMAGGSERVYDRDDDARPHGVGDEYTFDLSTL